MNNFNIYIGYDTREDIAYQVSKFSALQQSKNVSVLPLKLDDLKEKGLYWRGEDKLGSTEFTFSRFLVPELNDYKGWALFCDCDIIFLDDINNLFNLRDDKYAVMCVQHDYTPKEGTKMDGKQQTLYPEKIGAHWYYGIVGIHPIKKFQKNLSTTLKQRGNICTDLVG